MPICPGSPPLGSDADVERLLDVNTLRAKGMDGRNVAVAIVDTGLNIALSAVARQAVALRRGAQLDARPDDADAR